ncbi:alpha-1,3-fucosyltransferase, partial [Helicobacter didelphidarum]
MRVVDWWDEDTQENFYNNYFIKLLQEKFDIIYSNEPDFIIYSPFHRDEHLKYDCVRIFYTGENVRTDWNIADYAIDFDYMEFGDRHFRYPYFLLRGYKNLWNKHLVDKKDIESKTKFCGFVVSNEASPFTDIRKTFFEKLSEYKKVDSGGRWKNNVGYKVDNKIEWLKDYKFNICFENSSYPGYLTEKLFDAFEANCIPIYWGDTSLRGYKNFSNDTTTNY